MKACIPWELDYSVYGVHTRAASQIDDGSLLASHAEEPDWVPEWDRIICRHLGMPLHFAENELTPPPF
jgi:hypothetical protein